MPCTGGNSGGNVARFAVARTGPRRRNDAASRLMLGLGVGVLLWLGAHFFSGWARPADAR